MSFRPDVASLAAFYRSSRGLLAQRSLRTAMRLCWPERHTNQMEQVLGLGYATPLLHGFLNPKKYRMAAVMPAGQGVCAWPLGTENSTLLAEETELPFADGALDKILLLHALEFSENALLLPELWRALRPGGQMLCIVPARAGFWAFSEATPFGHGRPFSTRQLATLCEAAGFTPIQNFHALYTPPFEARWLRRISPLLEKIARTLKLPLGGALVMLAEKRLHAPIRGTKAPAYAPATAKLAVRGVSGYTGKS